MNNRGNAQVRALVTDTDRVKLVREALRERRAAVVFITVVALLVTLVAFAPSPASAAVQDGDMVDYDMTFPVKGDPGLKDTFGACRDGCSRGHEGQDLFAKKGTKVVAARGGTVR